MGRDDATKKTSRRRLVSTMDVKLPLVDYVDFNLEGSVFIR